MDNKEWNIEQLRSAIKELNSIQAKFYMDRVGNEVADILNDTQNKFEQIISSITGEEF